MNRRDMIAATALGGAGAAAVPLAAAAGTAASAGAAPLPRGAVRASDGTALHLQVFGGPGPALLFVASWALHGRMWDYQVAHFERAGFTCVTLDRRGHGRSAVPPHGYDMDILADDIDRAIRAIGGGKVTLVGHSMGCAEIIRYLARHGTARVRGVVMLAPVAPFILAGPDNPYGAPQALFDATEARYAHDLPGWAHENLPGFFTPSTSPALAAHLTGMLLETPVPVAIACYRTLYSTDLRPDLAAVAVPVLILHGARDLQAPLAITAERLAAGIRGARLKVYPDAPHGLWVTHLAEVNADIADFLKA